MHTVTLNEWTTINQVEWDLEKIYEFHRKWVNRGALRKLAAKGYKREHHLSQNRMSRGNFNKFTDSYQLLVEFVLMLWVEGKIKITSSGKQSKFIRDVIYDMFSASFSEVISTESEDLLVRSRYENTLSATMVIVKAYDIISQLKLFGNRLFEDETEQAYNEKVEAHNERSRKLNRELLNLPLDFNNIDLD